MTEMSTGDGSSAGGFEDWLTERVCQPIVVRLPRTLHPNTISLINHVLCWAVAVLAACAAWLQGADALIARSLAGVGLILSTIFDCLDGMHARHTGQCSKLGEVYDHGLDAANVLLAGATVVLVLGPSPWLFAVALNTTGFVYHAQLSYQHHTQLFVPPKVGGVSAQITSGLTCIAFGLLFYFTGHESSWVLWSVNLFVGGVVVVSVIVMAWYLMRNRKVVKDHAKFFVLNAAVSALFLCGVLELFVFTALVVCISFRVSGRFVLANVLAKDFNGWDWSAAIGVGIIAMLSPWQELQLFQEWALPQVLGMALCVWLVIANILALRPHLSFLAGR